MRHTLLFFHKFKKVYSLKSPPVQQTCHPWYWNSLIWFHPGGFISSGENSVHFLQQMPFTILNCFFVPPGTHHCWLDRGSMIWEACQHFSLGLKRVLILLPGYPTLTTRRVPGYLLQWILSLTNTAGLPTSTFFMYCVHEIMNKYVSTCVLIKYVGTKHCKYVLHSNSDNDGREVSFKIITTRYFAA